MGEVWLCEDPNLHRKVAIKTLPSHDPGDELYSERFRREAQAAAALNHPHILPIHDYGEERLPNGKILNYIVMPYIAEGSLADYIEKLANNSTGINQQEAITYLSQMADAFDYAHEQGVIHRDIKPANILMRSHNWPLLTDFGIAYMLSNLGEPTQHNKNAGTPEYMAPEQARGRAEAASDNYSLAVIAYQLLAGRLPFQAESAYATTIQHLTMTPPSPRQFNPYIPQEAEHVLLQGLAKQPAERFPTAKAFVAALQRGLSAPNIQHSQYPANNTLAQQQTYIPDQQQANILRQQQTEFTPIANTQPSKGSKQATRRRLLIGGGALILAAGVGVSIWELGQQQTGLIQIHQKTTPTTQPSPTQAITPTPDPNGPTLTLLGHNQPASALAWSPQKNMLLSVSNDHKAKSWDVQQFQSNSTIDQSTATKTLQDGNGMLLSWSPNGQYIAIANTQADLGKNGTYVSIYTSDLASYAPGYNGAVEILGDLSIQGIGWLQNRYIMTTLVPTLKLESIQINLLDTKSPKLQVKPLTINDGPIAHGGVSDNAQSLFLSPDNRQLAVLPVSNYLLLGKLIIGKKNTLQWQQITKLVFPGLPTNPSTAAWFGDYVLAISQDTPSSFVGWNTKNLKAKPIELSLPGSDTVLTTLMTDPQSTSSLIAAASKDGSIYLWDINKNMQPSRTLHNGAVQGKVTAMAWSADGQWLAASYDDINATILVWKL